MHWFDRVGVSGLESSRRGPSDVLVDATALDSDHRSRGIGRYVAGLVSGFSELAEEVREPGRDASEPALDATELEFLRLGGPLHRRPDLDVESGSDDATGRFEPDESRVRRLQRPPGPHLTRWILNEFHLARELEGACRLYHSTEPASVCTGPSFRSVVTMHDVIPLMFPDVYMRLPYLFWPLYYRWLDREDRWEHIDRVIAISEATRNELERHLGIPASKVTVVHNGIDHEQFRPVDDAERVREVRRRYDLPERFVLYLGGDDFRKNVEVLVAALPSIPDGVQLVLAGGIGDSARSELSERADRLGVRDRLVFPGYVDDADLAPLYAAAEVFAYPSLAEGFGLQILEAMAVGTAVVASDRSSLAEVTGEAGLLADPTDPRAFGAAIRRCSNDENARAKLEERGLGRASEFSWRRCAEETLEVYREVLVGE